MAAEADCGELADVIALCGAQPPQCLRDRSAGRRRRLPFGQAQRAKDYPMAATTANNSADMGMTRSRSLFEGATTSKAMTSPLGR